MHRDGRSRARQRARAAELREVLAGASVRGGAALPETAALDELCDAETARVDGLRDVREPGRRWRRPGGRWTGRFPAAYARWREAEVLLARASPPRRSRRCAPPTPPRVALTAGRLVGELESLARWYRLDLPPRCRPLVPSRDDAAGAGPREEPDDDALAAYGLTSREREVLTPAGRRAQQQGDRRGPVHQREDGLGPRLQHPAQARRPRPPGRRPDRAPAGCPRLNA